MKVIPPLTPEQQALVGTPDTFRLAGYFTRYYRRWYRNYHDELQSAALLGAVRAAGAFRNTHNRATFMRYVRDWMRSYMNHEITHIRSRGLKYHHGEMRRYSFDEAMFCPEAGRECPDIADMLDRVSRYLNASEERLMRLVYGEGLNMKEAADRIPSFRTGAGSVSPQYALQLHNAAIRKIRQYFPTPLHLMYGAA